MATFVQGWIRPGVYVKQTRGPGAAQLPSSFVAALIGHGADRYTISSKEITSDGSLLQVLDSDRNVASITSIKVNNIDVASNKYSIANAGNLPFGSANIAWAAGQAPASGTKYYVTYVAYRNPASDFDPVYVTDPLTQIDLYGAPAQSTADVLSGDSIKNNLSLGAYIANLNGATSWYSAQMCAFDNSTFGVTAAYGTSVGATGTAGSTGTELSLAINGEAAQAITVAAGLTGAAMAEAIQDGVRALTAANSALQAAYDQFTATYDAGNDQFTLTSGMVGSVSAVVVSAGVLASDLKLGVAAGGVETAGSGATLLNLASEAGLQTAFTQVLAKLELVDAYVLIPLFPMVSGGLNNGLISVFKTHVENMRSVPAQKWRVGLLGPQKNSDTGTNPETKYITAAGVLGLNAFAYVAPATSKFVYGGVEFTLPAWAIASAVGGIMSNPIYGSSEPIAGKQVTGFTEIKDTFNTTQRNLMGTAGVLMIDNELGTPAIIQDLTTDQSNAVASQLKFTRAGDYVSKSLRLILRKLYINVNNLGDTTLSNIRASLKMILQQMVWLNIINDFEVKKVAKNGSDSRQVDVCVDIQLVPDVSWIYVDLGVNL